MIPLGVLASSYVAPGGSGTTYYDQIMADSPLIYLRLDDTTGPPADDGSLSDSITAATSFPTFGATGLGDGATSADFPASITVGIGLGSLAPIASNGAATFEALISVDSIAANRNILSRSSVGGTQARFEVSSAGKLRYIGGPVFPVIITGASTLSTGTTYHVAVTHTGSSATLYVNGASDGTGSVSTYNSAPGTVWTVGRSLATGFEVPFDGKIAGFAMYDKALSASRILAHAQAAGVAA